MTSQCDIFRFLTEVWPQLYFLSALFLEITIRIFPNGVLQLDRFSQRRRNLIRCFGRTKWHLQVEGIHSAGNLLETLKENTKSKFWNYYFVVYKHDLLDDVEGFKSLICMMFSPWLVFHCIYVFVFVFHSRRTY